MSKNEQPFNEQISEFIRNHSLSEKERKLNNFRQQNAYIKPGQVLFTGSSLMERFPITEYGDDICAKKSAFVAAPAAILSANWPDQQPPSPGRARISEAGRAVRKAHSEKPASDRENGQAHFFGLPSAFLCPGTLFATFKLQAQIVCYTLHAASPGRGPNVLPAKCQFIECSIRSPDTPSERPRYAAVPLQGPAK